jgi:hypothetical protein
MIYLLIDSDCLVVANASWKPLYEIYTTSQDAERSLPLALHYRASITQKTGEDWAGVPLVLSTASNISLPSHIPRLPVYRIRGRDPVGTPTAPHVGIGLPITRPPVFGAGAASQAHGQSTSAGGLFGSNMISTAGNCNTQPSLFGQPTTAATPVSHSPFAQIPVQPQQIPEPALPESTHLEEETASVTLRTSPVPVSYAVSHLVHLPSDETPHTVSITSLQLKADIHRVCVPKIDAVVYLQAKITNNSNYRLVEGPVSVYLDDNFVTNTTIKVRFPISII